jgi:hypothetical protein
LVVQVEPADVSGLTVVSALSKRGTSGVTVSESQQTTGAAESPPAGGLGATLLRVAWLAILLGFVMEALLLLFAAGFGIFPGLKPMAADLVRQVSWSTIVCVGLALGTAVTKARVPLMGVLGLLAAPVAFTVSRSLHQGAVKTLEIAGSGADAPPVLLLAVLKAVEYACLGLAIGWLGRRAWGGMSAHLATGLLVGLVFGGTIVALTYQMSSEPPATADLVARGANEILFPVGCSLVLFAATAIGKRTES